MKTKTKFLLSVLAYLVPTMLLGMAWHFIFFKAQYESFSIYNRTEPIIPLGLFSMLIQGIIIAYLYPYFSREKNTVLRGIFFSLIMGIFLFSVSTIANTAKIVVTNTTEWFVLQVFFHLIQFIIAGFLIGLVHRK